MMRRSRKKVVEKEEEGFFMDVVLGLNFRWWEAFYMHNKGIFGNYVFQGVYKHMQ